MSASNGLIRAPYIYVEETSRAAPPPPVNPNFRFAVVFPFVSVGDEPEKPPWKTASTATANRKNPVETAPTTAANRKNPGGNCAYHHCDPRKRRECRATAAPPAPAPSPAAPALTTTAAVLLFGHPITISRLTERGLLRPSRATRRPLYSIEEIQRFLRDTASKPVETAKSKQL